MRGLLGIRGRSEPRVRSRFGVRAGETPGVPRGFRIGIYGRKLWALFPGIYVILAAFRAYAVFLRAYVPVLFPKCPGEVNAAMGTRSHIIRNIIAAKGALHYLFLLNYYPVPHF